jgi:twitching motility protein PilT
MKTTGRIREFIEQRDKTDMIKNAIEEGNAEGMITFDQYLLSMFRRGLITYDTAIHAASSPHDFKLLEQKDTDFADRIMHRMEQFQHTPGTTGGGDGL